MQTNVDRIETFHLKYLRKKCKIEYLPPADVNINAIDASAPQLLGILNKSIYFHYTLSTPGQATVTTV